MDVGDCLAKIQGFLENNPLIILGSGLSASYGLPSMSDLSEEIKGHKDMFDKAEFESLCKNIETGGLEEAINITDLLDGSLDKLRRIVWECVNKKDLAFFKILLQDRSEFVFPDLLKTIIRQASNVVTVVTTNYDRLAEYAADIIDATTVTGFEGELIRKAEFPDATLRRKRIAVREKIVNIWKVHGSLDWFSKNDGATVNLPLSQEIPVNYDPLVIAPGKGKYSFTHEEPYRTVITQADMAFSTAGSFLCIGYGFNDDHIQTKLIEKIKKGKPIVVLCKKATEACRQNVMENDVKKFAVIESSAETGKTLITWDSGTNTYDGDFWKLPDFMKAIWG